MHKLCIELLQVYSSKNRLQQNPSFFCPRRITVLHIRNYDAHDNIKLYLISINFAIFVYNLHRSKHLFLKHIFSHFQEVIERHEAVMGQLMSGEPKNQNIPGLDSILRGEILRKDGLIRYHTYIT